MKMWKTAEQILAWEPKYKAGQVLTFMCGNVSAQIGGERFKAGERITIKLCTDWDGQEYVNPATSGRWCWPWELIGGHRSYSARTIYRIAEIIHRENSWEVWARDVVGQGVVP